MEIELGLLLESGGAEINADGTSSPVPGSSPPAKRLKLTAREVVDSVKTSVLLAAHRKFYAEWSNGRKKAGSQVIPKEIWPKVIFDVN
jgi:hypothetical protein